MMTTSIDIDIDNAFVIYLLIVIGRTPKCEVGGAL
jgi:hypothetical protein